MITRKQKSNDEAFKQRTEEKYKLGRSPEFRTSSDQRVRGYLILQLEENVEPNGVGKEGCHFEETRSPGAQATHASMRQSRTDRKQGSSDGRLQKERRPQSLSGSEVKDGKKRRQRVLRNESVRLLGTKVSALDPITDAPKLEEGLWKGTIWGYILNVGEKREGREFDLRKRKPASSIIKEGSAMS